METGELGFRADMVVYGDVYVATDELGFRSNEVVVGAICKKTCCLAVR